MHVVVFLYYIFMVNFSVFEKAINEQFSSMQKIRSILSLYGFGQLF